MNIVSMLDGFTYLPPKQETDTSYWKHKWNFVCVYYINTLDYDPNERGSYKCGLELIDHDVIPFVAHLTTEEYFHQMAIEDTLEGVAEACKLDEVDPGYYRCVCGVVIEGGSSTSWEGITEYDEELYHELISRTKLTAGEVDSLLRML